MHPAVLFATGYSLVVGCLVFPPPALVSEQLTLDALLASFGPREDRSYIHHHMHMTTLTLAAHALLLLGFVAGTAGLLHDDPSWNATPELLQYAAMLLAVAAVVLAFTMLAHAFRWSLLDGEYHPSARNLSAYSPTWRHLARQIDMECRRMDCVVVNSHEAQLVITSDWILQRTWYNLHIANHNDVDMSILGSETIPIAARPAAEAMHANPQLAALAYTTGGVASDHTVQMIRIHVTAATPGVQPFDIRLNSTDFSAIQDKLTTIIRNAQSIVIAQTLSDRFVTAFLETVSQNPVYPHPASSSHVATDDMCVGCMAHPPRAKIVQRCQTPTACTPCYCRPMWCLECLGKWFASKQNPAATSNWLNGTAQCPTCRATFCLLDVRRVV
ncbi:transmembrane protein [Capsaspora owczarzaki ATCC 30864]|uniref:Transmembrane protein n=1 Tax=Capsaspora owczarzaki (strain ATCC 30864) TaxID=595528 RepID=A0A0D2VKU8_CAPO3|nr:transmembrane protein [Capsaspora owczarzaki ATCC 30864]KJE90682.1 transmembrane protein [Capsaspora owczarzaki ATCC 30864]|eukprot:XP_004364820.1 transmembrane protein [Capsaspora owczarzaki ATCC 30864]